MSANKALQTAPPFDANVYARADWFELYTVAKGTVYYSEIERAWERVRESEDADFEDSDAQFDDWLSATVAVIERRKAVGKEYYPFRFTEDDSGLSFLGASQLTTGQQVYLLCLFLSTLQVSSVYAVLQNISHKARDLFQACSAWAAAGLLHGCSYAFGWPRPDHTDFHSALCRVFHDLMGDADARVHDARPAGASVSDKDGGIDVIAWKPRVDRHPGKLILIGQVATGENWRNKSVKEYIDRLVGNWFSSAPPINCVPAMFIPFSIVPEEDGVSVGQQLRYWTPQYGQILYRDVMPWYAAKGVALASSEPDLYCDRLADEGALGEEVAKLLETVS